MSDQSLSPIQLASLVDEVGNTQQLLGAFAAKATSQTMGATASLAGDMNDQAKAVHEIGTILAVLTPIVGSLGMLTMGLGTGAHFMDGLRKYAGYFGTAGLYGTQMLGLLATGGASVAQDVYKSRVDLDQSAATTVQKGGQQMMKASKNNQQTSSELARTAGGLVKSIEVKTN